MKWSKRASCKTLVLIGDANPHASTYVWDGKPIGITLLSDPKNLRPSWWHNRDYGVFVANPFGRAAMKQGEKSAVTVTPGGNFRLRFGALIHAGTEFNPATAYREFR
jgi:hypothetical protein